MDKHEDNTNYMARLHINWKYPIECPKQFKTYSKKKIDSTSLNWHSINVTGKTFSLINCSEHIKVRFYQAYRFQVLSYSDLDSNIITQGKWGFNPEGWLLLRSDDDKIQKYAIRNFRNFSFLVKDSEIKALESDFNNTLVGKEYEVKDNQITSQDIINTCLQLQNRYFICRL